MTGNAAIGEAAESQAEVGRDVVTPERDTKAASSGASSRSSARIRPPKQLPASPLESLLEDPSRFAFDATVALLMRARGASDPGDAIRFQAALGLAFVPSDVASVKRSPHGFIFESGALGLTGPSGVLPRPYTEMANGEHRRRSSAYAAFLDMLAQRPIAQFAAAGIKYRPHRTADVAAGAGADDARTPRDGLREMLLGLIGYTDDGMRTRLRIGIEPLLYYAGAFSARPRSADRLAAILSDWLGQAVEVEQFSGTWLDVPPDQRSRLSCGGKGRFNCLGVDTAAGVRVWDIQSRITLRIGPLEYHRFEALLPNGPLLKRIVAFTRAYLGLETGFAINPVLASHAVPAPALGATSRCRLGWTGWLPVSAGRKDDAKDARFLDTKAA